MVEQKTQNTMKPAKIYTHYEWEELMKDYLLAPVDTVKAWSCLRPMGMDEVMTKNGAKEPKRLAGENQGIFTEDHDANR